MPDRDIENLDNYQDSKMTTIAQRYQSNTVPGNSLPPLSQLMAVKQEGQVQSNYQQQAQQELTSNDDSNHLTQIQFQQMTNNQANYYPMMQPDQSPNMTNQYQQPQQQIVYPYMQTLPQQQQQQNSSQQQQQQQQQHAPPLPQLDSTHLFEKCTCKSENNHIPRPRNAFILFRQKNHQALLDEGDVIRTNPDVSRELGKRWRNLSPSEKEYWNRCAEDEKKRHAEKYPGYKYSPRRNSKKNCPSCKAKLALRNHNLNIQSYLAQYPNSTYYPTGQTTIYNQPQQGELEQVDQQSIAMQQQQSSNETLQQQYQQPTMMYSAQYLPAQQQLLQMFNDMAIPSYYIEQPTGYINTTATSATPATTANPASNQYHHPQLTTYPTTLNQQVMYHGSSNGSRSYHTSTGPYKVENNSPNTYPLQQQQQPQPKVSPTSAAHQQLPSINNLSLPPPFQRE